MLEAPKRFVYILPFIPRDFPVREMEMLDQDETCRILLEHWFADPAPAPRVTTSRIKAIVAKEFSVRVVDLESIRRTQDVVMPRQIAMYLARTLTPASLPEIGHRFGGRDHSTVFSAVRKIEAMIAADAGFAARIDALKAKIEAA